MNFQEQTETTQAWILTVTSASSGLSLAVDAFSSVLDGFERMLH